jgi:hypothetical protein
MKPRPKPTATPGDTPSPSPSPAPTGGVAIVLPGAGGLGGGPDGGGDTPGQGPVDDGGMPSATSLGGGDNSPLGLLLKVMPALVVTTGAATMTMAFIVFGKRRRNGEPEGTDEQLAAAAATGLGYVPAGAPGPDASSSPDAAAAVSKVQAANAVVAPGSVDGHLPRWRRPSLIEARKTDPTRMAVPAGVKLTFDGTIGDAVDGMERRRIRYRLVSLLDSPDEVRGSEIGTVDEGDEVVLLEKRGTYWLVLCPDGRQGWLHKMTLGDVVIAAGGAPDTWTSADNGPTTGTFEDILRAYSEQRRQFGEAS